MRKFWDKPVKPVVEEKKKRKEVEPIIIPTLARRNVVEAPPHEPRWDMVKRRPGQDDFLLVTWIAHLYQQRDRSQEETATALYNVLKGNVESAQLHWHYETCKKNGHEGNDESCRLEQPRLIVNRSR